MWLSFLRLLAHRRGAMLVVASIVVLLFASQIRTPAIEGSLFKQVAGSNPRLTVAQQIADALDGRVPILVVHTARAGTIADAFDEVAALRNGLAESLPASTLEGIDRFGDQLFVYGLEADTPVSELLEVLGGIQGAELLVSRNTDQFVSVVTVAGADEQRALEILAALADGNSPRWLSAQKLDNEVAAALGRDLTLLIPAIVVVMLLALYAAFGSWRALALPAFSSVATTLIILSLFSLGGVTINLVTLLSLPVVLIVALANSCHFLSKLTAVAADQRSIDDALVATLERIALPYLISSVTTAIAFSSLALNELRPIAEFGIVSAIALVASFCVTLLAAPMSLVFFSGRRETGAMRDVAWATWSRVSAWARSQRTALSAALAMVLLAGLFVVPRLSVDSNPRLFFPESADFTADLAIFEAEFYAFAPLQLLIGGGGDDADRLRASGELRDRLVAREDVVGVQLVPAADRAFVLSVFLVGDEATASVTQAIDSWSRTTGRAVAYASPILLYEAIDAQALASLAESLAWSAALIFGAILIVFRSVRLVIGSVVANSVPLALVCLVIWALGAPLNLVTAFVFLVALGVIVDDTIHILHWQRSGDQLTGSSVEFSVAFTTFMLCLGLLLCQLSDFPTTRLFASYCALALGGALVSDLTLLPLFRARTPERPGSAD